MSFRIRPYELKDLGRIAELEKECFENPWSYSAFCMEYADKNKFYFVAETEEDGDTGESGGKVIGYGGFAHVEDEAHIMNIGVAEDSRRQGVGHRILQAILDKSRELGIRAATLEVNDANAAAIALYEKTGFVLAGLRPHYYGWDKPARIYWYYFPDKG